MVRTVLRRMPQGLSLRLGIVHMGWTRGVSALFVSVAINRSWTLSTCETLAALPVSMVEGHLWVLCRLTQSGIRD